MMMAVMLTMTVLVYHCHHFALFESFTAVGFDSDEPGHYDHPRPNDVVNSMPSGVGDGSVRFPGKRFFLPAGYGWTRENGKWRPTLLQESIRPAFTPYIGATALTNLPKFFQHFRENLDSILEDTNQHKSNRKGCPERPSKINRGKIFQRPLPATRRDYLEGQEGSSSSIPIRFCRTRRSRCGGRHDEKKTRDLDLAPSLDGKSKPESHYPNPKAKANNLNPGWLFTNLGLGKRDKTN